MKAASASSSPPSSTFVRQTLLVCLSSSWGSFEEAALEAAEALRRRGVRVSVGALPGTKTESEAVARGFELVLLAPPIDGRRRSTIAAALLNFGRRTVKPFAAAAAIREWVRWHADGALLCARLSDVLVARPALAFTPGARLVASAIFADSFGKGGRGLFGLWSFSRVNALIAHSNAQRLELLRKVPVPAARVSIVAPSIHVERFGPELRSETLRGDWRLAEAELAIGAIVRPEAGESAPATESPGGGLLQALAILARNKPRLKWKLTLLADPADGESAQKTAAAWAADAAARVGADRVLLTDAKTPIAEFCASVDLFVATARPGAYDARLIEAMASGTPTFAPSGGVVAEAFKDARATLLWRSGNPWDLARQLERAILDGPLRARVATEGRALARARHDVGAFEKELYRSVMGAAWTAPVTAESATLSSAVDRAVTGPSNAAYPVASPRADATI